MAYKTIKKINAGFSYLFRKKTLFDTTYQASLMQRSRIVIMHALHGTLIFTKN